MGFKAKWGPTTAERRSPCFNQTQDEGECNWAGPSWPCKGGRWVCIQLCRHDVARVSLRCVTFVAADKHHLAVGCQDSFNDARYSACNCHLTDETARVLTGLANFLIDYPKTQSAGVNVTATTFVDLLRTYAISHTSSTAANGTRQEPADAPSASRNQPWVGENVRRSIFL